MNGYTMVEYWDVEEITLEGGIEAAQEVRDDAGAALREILEG